MDNEPVAELVLEQMAVGDASSLRVKWLVDNYPPVGTKLYTHPVKELTDEEIIESLAELEHEQWMKWADTIMQTEKISDARFARWASCMISYAELTEEMKEFDREWARKALAILRKAQEK